MLSLNISVLLPRRNGVNRINLTRVQFACHASGTYRDQPSDRAFPSILLHVTSRVTGLVTLRVQSQARYFAAPEPTCLQTMLAPTECDAICVGVVSVDSGNLVLHQRFTMRRSGPHEPLEGSGLKFQYRTNAAFSLLGGPKPVSQEAGVTPLTSPAFSKRRGSGAASSAGGNRLSLGAASSEPVVLKLSELMAQTQASRTMLTSKVRLA